ncbi:MAG: CHASE2 domain-containing protein [Thermodesulfobacteriota bacterium]
MKDFFKNRTHPLFAVLIGIFCSIIALFLYTWSPSVLNELDLRLGDLRFKIRGVKTPNPDIVIAAIDEKSINNIGRWIWSRSKFAEFVNTLNQYDTRIIAFDILFSETESKEADSKLSEALKNNGNIVLGYFFRDVSSETLNKDSLKINSRSKIKLIKYINMPEQNTIKKYLSAELNIPIIANNAAGFGFFNVSPDQDGIYRQAPLIVNFNEDYYPSLSLEALSKYLNSNLFLKINNFGISSINLDNLAVPVNEKGELLLNYYGKKGVFPTYSIIDILEGKIPREYLEKKLLLIGATEIGIADLRATPFDPVTPGVEIQATVAANILDKNFLVKDGFTKALDLLLIFLLPIIISVVLYNTKNTFPGFIAFVLFVSIFLVSNFLVFTKLNLVLSIFFPLISIFLTYIFYEIYRNLIIEKESRFIRKAFNSYVSPKIVDQLINNPNNLNLGGERKRVTMLFSDIRDFTSQSETTDPEILVDQLNDYLSPMTEIVMNNEGTLDKFMGDGLMAIYGAPVEINKPSLNACISSIQMINKLRNLNLERVGNDFHELKIGIGINTGEAIVGNMGANIRFDFTAIGDAVNLASRLEGLTKYYGVEIIISESVKDEISLNEAAENKLLFRELDLVKVKGKKESVKIYELMILNKKFNQLEYINKFSSALSKFRERDFENSLVLFENLLNLNPNDMPTKIYIERCKDFILNPPSTDWNFVYEFD